MLKFELVQGIPADFTADVQRGQIAQLAGGDTDVGLWPLLPTFSDLLFVRSRGLLPISKTRMLTRIFAAELAARTIVVEVQFVTRKDPDRVTRVTQRVCEF